MLETTYHAKRKVIYDIIIFRNIRYTEKLPLPNIDQLLDP